MQLPQVNSSTTSALFISSHHAPPVVTMCFEWVCKYIATKGSQL